MRRRAGSRSRRSGRIRRSISAEADARPGIAVSLYGVRSERNWGCGDFTDLRAVIDWAADDLQASFVALNPLHAIHNRRPFNTSPYLPNCVYYQNFLYLDVEAIEDFAVPRRAQRFRECPASGRGDRGTAAVGARRVRARRVAQAAIPEAAVRRVSAGAAARRRRGAREFEAFVTQEGDAARGLRHVLRARRASAPAQSRPLDLDAMAGGVSGPALAGNAGLPAETLARR